MKIKPFYRIHPNNCILTSNPDIAAARRKAAKNPNMDEKQIEEYIRQWVLKELFEIYGYPKEWLKASGVQTLYIEPGSPWENGYIESFNGKLRDELLNREIFETLFEAKVLVDRRKTKYNTVRPHSSLNYQPPAPEAIKLKWLENTVTLLRTGTTFKWSGLSRPTLQHS